MVRQLESNEVGLPLEVYCFQLQIKSGPTTNKFRPKFSKPCLQLYRLFTLSTFQRLGGRQQEL